MERAKHDHPEPNEEVIEVKKFLESVEFVRTYKIKQQDTGKYEKLLASIKVDELMWEHLQTPMLNSPNIWNSLINTIPPHALIRNLGRLSRLNVVTPGNRQNEKTVIERLTKTDALENAKVHPITVLTALCQYKNGMSHNGKKRWPINEQIIRALWNAFYKTFGSVRATKKKLLVAINVNTSMKCPVVGSPALSSKETAFSLAKLIYEVERGANNHNVKGITFYSEPREIDLSGQEAAQQLATNFQMATHKTNGSLPFQYADIDTEGFIIFTDFLESNDKGTILRAFKEYRKMSGVTNAKLVVVGLSNSDFCLTGGDGTEENVMDVAGVDISALNRMMAFLADTPSDLEHLLGELTIYSRC